MQIPSRGEPLPTPEVDKWDVMYLMAWQTNYAKDTLIEELRNDKNQIRAELNHAMTRISELTLELKEKEPEENGEGRYRKSRREG